MLIFATFKGTDSNFTQIIDTTKLEKSLRSEVEKNINTAYLFSGDEYFCDIQEGAFIPVKFPITIDGIIDVYEE